MRIKCPNCGSTAQPELVYLDHKSNSTRKTDVYECGCGCEFEVIYEYTSFNILKIDE